MENDTAKDLPATSDSTLVRLLYRVVFFVPLICAAFGMAGFVQGTAMGLPFGYTAVWLALTLASVSWAFTHWFGLLRRKGN